MQPDEQLPSRASLPCRGAKLQLGPQACPDSRHCFGSHVNAQRSPQKKVVLSAWNGLHAVESARHLSGGSEGVAGGQLYCSVTQCNRVDLERGTSTPAACKDARTLQNASGKPRLIRQGSHRLQAHLCAEQGSQLPSSDDASASSQLQ